MVRTAHTAELDAATLKAAHALMIDAFAGELTDQDWDNCLGGLHALAYEHDELIGHAALVQRHLIHEGRSLRAGYVEGVGVRADRRRRGVAGALMDAVERVIGQVYELGALGSSDDGLPFYLGRGWRAWDGPLAVLTPDGIVETPDEEGWILVFGTSLSGGTLTCGDWRTGDVW